MTEQQAEYVSRLLSEIKTLRDAIEEIDGIHTPYIIVRTVRWGNDDKWHTTEINLPPQLKVNVRPILEQELKELEEELSTFYPTEQ